MGDINIDKLIDKIILVSEKSCDNLSEVQVELNGLTSTIMHLTTSIQKDIDRLSKSIEEIIKSNMIIANKLESAHCRDHQDKLNIAIKGIETMDNKLDNIDTVVNKVVNMDTKFVSVFKILGGSLALATAVVGLVVAFVK